jgi:hypothetical protein
MPDKTAGPIVDRERLEHGIFRAHPSRLWGYLVGIISILGALWIMRFTDDARVPDAAIAGLVAALIGVVGTHVAHAVSAGHANTKPNPLGKPGIGQDIIVLLFVMIIIGLIFTGVVISSKSQMAGIDAEAAAVLIAAVIGIPASDLAHEGWFLGCANSKVYRFNLLVGPAIMGISVAAAMGLIWLNPPMWDAEGIAAFAAVGIGIGGILLGHCRTYHGLRGWKANAESAGKSR